MGQDLSQPARWTIAANRAADAALELRRLREEWIEMRVNFVDQWTVQRDEYVVALDELVRLQRIYAHGAYAFDQHHSRHAHPRR